MGRPGLSLGPLVLGTPPPVLKTNIVLLTVPTTCVQDNIVEYMKQQASAPSEEKNSKLGITNNMDRLDITVVGFFNGKTDLYDEFMVAANEMRGTFR